MEISSFAARTPRAGSGEVHSPTRLRRGAFRIVKERYKNGVFKGGRKFFEICED